MAVNLTVGIDHAIGHIETKMKINVFHNVMNVNEQYPVVFHAPFMHVKLWVKFVIFNF